MEDRNMKHTLHNDSLAPQRLAIDPGTDILGDLLKLHDCSYSSNTFGNW